MHPNAIQRLQVLEILYLALEAKPKAGWVNIKQIVELGDMEFAIATLIELAHINKNGFNYRITDAGILAYEAAYQAE